MPQKNFLATVLAFGSRSFIFISVPVSLIFRTNGFSHSNSPGTGAMFQLKFFMKPCHSGFVFVFFIFHIFFNLIFYLTTTFYFSSAFEDVSQKMNGLRSFSIDQSLSLKIAFFSILKRVNKSNVACKFVGDNLLCSNKNCCFLVILK